MYRTLEKLNLMEVGYQSDDVLEMALFSMNSENAGCEAVVNDIKNRIWAHAQIMECWIAQRMESKKEISEGLEDEIRMAVQTMDKLASQFETLAYTCRLDQETLECNLRRDGCEQVLKK